MSDERKVWFGGMSTADVAMLHPRDVAEELERFGPIERVEMKERCFIVTMERRRDAENLVQHPRPIVCGHSCVVDSYKSKKSGPYGPSGALSMTKGNGSLGIDAEDRLEELKANTEYASQINLSAIVEKLKDLAHPLQARAIETYLQSDLKDVRNPMGWFSSIIRTLSLGLDHGSKANQHGFNGRNSRGRDRPQVSIREDLESPRTLARKLAYQRSRSRRRRRRSGSRRRKDKARSKRDKSRRRASPDRKAGKGAGKGEGPRAPRSFSLVRSGSSGSSSKSGRKSRSRSKSSSSSRSKSRSATNNDAKKDDAKSIVRPKRTFVDSPVRGGSRPSSRRSKPQAALLVSKEEALDGWSSCSEGPQEGRENVKNQPNKPKAELLVSKEEALDGWSSCSEEAEEDRGNDKKSVKKLATQEEALDGWESASPDEEDKKKLATQEEALDGWESASPDDDVDKNDKTKRSRARSADSAIMPSDHGSVKSRASNSRKKTAKDVDYIDNDQSASEKSRSRAGSRSCLVTRSRSRTRSPSRSASPNRSRSRSASPRRSRSRSASPRNSRVRSLSPVRSPVRSRSRSVSSAPAEISPFERRSRAPPTPKSSKRKKGRNESPIQKHRATEATGSPFEFTRRSKSQSAHRSDGGSSPQVAESVSRAHSIASSPAIKQRAELPKKNPSSCVLVPNTQASSSQLVKAASKRAAARVPAPKLTSRKESARRANAASAAPGKLRSAAATAATDDLEATKMPKISLTKAHKKTAEGNVAAPVAGVSKNPKQTLESKKQAMVAKQTKPTKQNLEAKQAKLLAAKQAKHAQALKQAKLAKHALALKQAKHAQASKVAGQPAATKQVTGTAQRLKRQRDEAKETATSGAGLKVASRRLPDSISPRTRALLGDGAKWLKKEQDAAKVEKDKLKAKSNLVSLLLKAPNGKVKHVMHRAEATIREILQAHGKDPLQYRFLFEGHRVSRDVSVKELNESIPAGKKGNGVLTLCLEKLVRVEIFLGDEVFEEQLPGNMTVADLFEDLRVRGLETDIDNLCCQNKDGVEYGKDLTLSTLDAKSGSSKKGKPLKLHVARGEWDSD